jgi:hypothetical protein
VTGREGERGRDSWGVREAKDTISIQFLLVV